MSYIAPFAKPGAVPWPVNRNSLVFSPTVITAHQIGCLVTFDNTHLVININVKLQLHYHKSCVFSCLLLKLRKSVAFLPLESCLGGLLEDH